MKIDTGTNELLCVVRDGVALITLNRPEARNAMSPDLTAALRTQIKERGEDADVGALLITGAGTAFCSGGDVKGMGGRGPRGQMSFEERLADLRWRQADLTGALFARAQADDRGAARRRRRRGPRHRARLRHPDRGEVGLRQHRLRAHRPVGRLRHRLAADPRGRLGAGARADVHRRAGRCRALRAHRPGQPRGRRRQAAGRGLRPGQVAGRGSARRLPQHEGQSRRGAAHRLPDRAAPRGRAAGRRLAHRRPQGGGAAFVEKRKPVFDGGRRGLQLSTRRVTA